MPEPMTQALKEKVSEGMKNRPDRFPVRAASAVSYAAASSLS